MIPEKLNYADILCLLKSDGSRAQQLFDSADSVRSRTKGNTVNVRAIIEFSNRCRRNCAYCGLNCGNTSLPRYAMEPEEIIETAVEGYGAGYKTVVLQSGEDPYYTVDMLCHIVKSIKEKTEMAITLSCGEMSEEDFALIRKSGCDRYLLKHETSDADLYSRLHPGYSLTDRIECLRTLKRLGFETGGGFMIGLPGQSLDTIVNDLLLIASIPCDMAGIGPFIPHPETELRSASPGDVFLTRKAVAIARLLLPDANLPATTSLAVRDKEERNKIFSGGANVIMKKITPPRYRELYEIYPANHGRIKSVAEEREEINRLLTSLGREYD
ncbi:MAG: [FeFe] hydrogenase H-cluster radical SAM maturase HydE [Ruminococcaceae bacterium]|nr:[FeFe] hydrogenase H-cluster radical SAM maturase HydE [Oscillospiraceae bacterium]